MEKVSSVKTIIKDFKGDNVNIAILDSGVYREHPLFKNTEMKEYQIKDDGIFYDASDNYGHGTAVLSILNQLICNAYFHVFKIYEDENFAQCDNLVRTLEYIYHNLQCDIIHFSVGVELYSEDLFQICKLLYQKGVIIVAAFDNSGSVSYPAAFDFVIGVESTDYCNKIDDFIYVKNDIVNILVKESNQRIAWKEPLYKISRGNSFATPYITAIIAKLLQYGISRTEIKKVLESMALQVIENKTGSNERQLGGFLPHDRVAIFPYNKEIHSLVNFSDQLNFHIGGIFDVKESGNVNRNVCGLYQDCCFQIKNIESADFKNIDYFIIGHLDALSMKCCKDLKEMVLQKCLDYSINVYSLDNYLYDKYYDQFRKANLKFAIPNFPQKTNYFGNLYAIHTPILGIYGTSSRQGKFTLQMILRKLFCSEGYEVCQLGTEPTSLLFGFDKVYPYGYNGIVGNNQHDNIQILNQMMFEMSLKNPDIIITGAQSGTIPFIFSNVAQIPIQTVTFLLGTMPDAVILVVNPSDSDEIIFKTIAAIESLSTAKVIAICLFVYDFINGWDILNENKRKVSLQLLENKKFTIKEQTGLEVFIHSLESDMKCLYDKCIGFFSEENDFV